MFKFFLLFFFISIVIHAQNNIYQAAKDSDAVLITNKEVSLNKITSIDFIELLDSNCFINYPLPPASVRFIKHECNFYPNGLCNHYDWSFSEHDSILKNEIDASSGHFFIPNDYDFVYDGAKLKEIHISDASLIRNVVYQYDKDSIYLNFSYYLAKGTLTEKKIAYNNSTSNSKSVISHTGIKKFYFPKTQIINLGIVHSYSIFINGIPVSSFMSGKFEQKRFFMEIHPGLYIFFEIGD